MSSEFADDEVSGVGEPIERRRSPRGPVRGLDAWFPDDAVPHRVVEAGLQGVFVACDDLERFSVGDSFEVTLSRQSDSFQCQVEVVRKESGPRRGYALEVKRMSDEARDIFERMRA